NMHKTLKKVTGKLQKIAIRDAVNQIIQFAGELNRYTQDGVKKDVFNECKEKLTLMLHPIAPHMTEEVWEILGKKGFLSLAKWPSYNKKMLTAENDFKWNLMNNTLESINHIKSIIKKDDFEKIVIIVADQWKFDLNKILIPLVESNKNQGAVIKEIMKNSEFKQYGKFISQIVGKALKNIGKFPKITLSADDEFSFFSDIKPIIEKKYNCEVDIQLEKDSKEQKANQAYPGRPAIVVY
ncbi:MAG: class I tRNA ligase family protein, partial [Promethearchaeota archaeon]